MKYHEIIAQLYFMLIHVDKKTSETELASAKYIINAEGLNEREFNAHIESIKSKNKDVLYNDSLIALKKLEREQQIRIVAWLCVAANADGFMDRTEWQLIYKIYHKELNLPLNEIFLVQKELNKLIWEQFSMTI